MNVFKVSPYITLNFRFSYKIVGKMAGLLITKKKDLIIDKKNIQIWFGTKFAVPFFRNKKSLTNQNTKT